MECQDFLKEIRKQREAELEEYYKCLSKINLSSRVVRSQINSKGEVEYKEIRIKKRLDHFRRMQDDFNEELEVSDVLEDYLLLDKSNNLEEKYIMKSRRDSPQWQFLTLELPFKTDPVSINHSYTTKEKNLGEKVKESFDQLLKKKSPRKTLFTGSNLGHFKGLPPKCNIQTIWENNPSQREIPREDYSRPHVLALFGTIIEKSCLSQKSKKIYQSHINKYFESIFGKKRLLSQVNNQSRTEIEVIDTEKTFKKTQEYNIPTLEQIDPYVLALLFEYLEQKCLKNNRISDYTELLEIRTIFYIDLDSSKLNEIKTHQICEKNKFLKYEIDNIFYFPGSYIKLLKMLKRPDEPLISKTSKQLNKMIERCAKECGLDEIINPTYIKKGIKAICWHNGFIPEKLPHR